jgi:hypothetical protein
MRGVHDAIGDLRRLHPARPVRVLYAGCGPYGVLGVPLLTILSPQEVSFTLLDFHVESIDAVRSIVDTLGVSDRVADSVAVDAGCYSIDPRSPPDLILMEMMQAALEAEPQVAVSRHLLRQAPGAVLIPEKVSLDLMMVDPALEFDSSSDGSKAAAKENGQIPVGPLFVIDREVVGSWDGRSEDYLPASTVRIPEKVPPSFLPMLFTGIRIYRQHYLGAYESGLTCPRLPSIEGAIQPGTKIQFRYELGPHPKLVGRVCP